MATRKEFCDAMLEAYMAHSVYIGGANGENTESLTIGRIRRLEEGYAGRDHASDINRDLCFIGKCYKAGYDMSRSLAGDCSGIVVGIMRALGILKATDDLRACEFQSKAEEIPLSQLSPGDLVFDTKKPDPAKHMGTYTGDGYVVESKGRDAGVVYRPVADGGWKSGGRLNGWFEEDIPVLTRNLKYVEGNLMKGEDVRECQERLTEKGYNCGEIDGVYGKKSRDAVCDFQEDNPPLEVDGIVGQQTWGKLWE